MLKRKFLYTLIAVPGMAGALFGDDLPVHLAGRSAQMPGAAGCFNVADQDRAMEQAVDHAQRSLGFFISALKARKTADTEFAIKKGFSEGDDVEHLWVNDLTWDGTNFRGKIDNRPVDLKNVWLGERVIVLPQDVSDWMFVKSHSLMGGYSMRVLYQRLSPEEKARFDNQVRFKIK